MPMTIFIVQQQTLGEYTKHDRPYC
jgi:hypothetical protein